MPESTRDLRRQLQTTLHPDRGVADHETYIAAMRAVDALERRQAEVEALAARVPAPRVVFVPAVPQPRRTPQLYEFVRGVRCCDPGRQSWWFDFRRSVFGHIAVWALVGCALVVWSHTLGFDGVFAGGVVLCWLAAGLVIGGKSLASFRGEGSQVCSGGH